MTQVSKARLGTALWILGMLGVVVMTLTVIPHIVQHVQTTIPHGVVIAASLAQSGFLLALAAWSGAALSPSVGLAAPATQAALSRQPVWNAMQPQLLPGALAGLATGVVLLVAAKLAPPEVVRAGDAFPVPAAVRLLYGGITEEILMRWGLMTLLVWLPWRFVQKRSGVPKPGVFLFAVLSTALLFGILHLPAAAAFGIALTPTVVGYILAGNAVPGILFGLAYWRRGLECAFIGHIVAHLVALAAGAM